MSSFKNADAGVIVDQLIKTIQKERDYLSEIDGKIGDGDHGINMNKGFTMCEKKLEGTTYNLSEGLTTLGETLLEDIGGSMGPLYGMLFDEMAQACEDEEEITADVFAEMITASVEGIPKKPDPSAALEIANHMNLPAEEVLYIGDSKTDMETGQNAKMDTIGVAWGFRGAEELRENNATYIVEKPEAILEYVI